MKKILYIDLDGPCANYDKAKTIRDYTNPLFFVRLELVKGCKEAIEILSKHYDVYWASTAPWSLPSSWMEKRLWIDEKFGHLAFKKLILTHNKGLLKGDYIIDDRNVNGVEEFEGEHIHYGSEKFPSWKEILIYLLENNKYE